MRRCLLFLALAAASAAVSPASSIASEALNVSGSDDSARVDYTGDDWRVGLGLSDESDVVAEVLGVLAIGERDSWIAEGWYQNGAGGLKLNYHWLPGDGDPAQQNELPGVYKLYVAADQNRWDDRKLSLGAGYEKQDVFWSTSFSLGLTDERRIDDVTQVSEEFLFGEDAMGRSFRQLRTTTVLTETFEQGYDYGAGGRVGRFFNEPNVRIQAGLDYEWGDYDSDQITLSGTAEKFFTGTGHSLALSVEHYKKSGNFELDDSDTRATLSWRYAFGQSYRSRTADVSAANTNAMSAMSTSAARKVEEVETRVVRNRVDMEADAFFSFASDSIRRESRERLQEVADLIRSGQILGRVSVVGHTCDLGPESYNQSLSARRAEAVKRELVKLGVDPEAIVTDGRGEADPRVPNISEENRKLNRRVDVQFIRVVETEETVSVARRVEPETQGLAVREDAVSEVPAWALRALRNPAQHKRTVDVYRFERTEVTVTDGERELLNQAPVAEDDTATVARNGGDVFINVLANDNDADGDVLTIESITQPASGSVVNSGDFLTYTPAEGFQGEESFTYTVTDGTDSTKATVTVTVSNDAPVAVADTAEAESGVPQLIDVLANDLDPNGDALELVSVSAAGSGTTSLVGDRVRYEA
ncbi:MAG: Ig-like domain-containing protein, partial [Pseudomonadales bacterium]